MSAFFCLFFHFQARNCGFFTINPYFWTPKIGLSEAKLAMNDYFVKLSPISVNINPVIWSRLFLVKIIPHIHHPRLQRVFRPSLSLLRREERAGSLLIKKRRTSSLRGAYAYLIWSIMKALFHDDLAVYRQYFINIAGSLILFTTILISANWALRLRWRRPSGYLPTLGLSGNRCRRCEGLRLPAGCRWCCR